MDNFCLPDSPVDEFFDQKFNQLYQQTLAATTSQQNQNVRCVHPSQTNTWSWSNPYFGPPAWERMQTPFQFPGGFQMAASMPQPPMPMPMPMAMPMAMQMPTATAMSMPMQPQMQMPMQIQPQAQVLVPEALSMSVPMAETLEELLLPEVLPSALPMEHFQEHVLAAEPQPEWPIIPPTPAPTQSGSERAATRRQDASSPTSPPVNPARVKKTYPCRRGTKLQNRSCDRCKKDKKKCVVEEGMDFCKYCYDKGCPCERSNVDRRRKSDPSLERQGQMRAVQSQTIAVPMQAMAVQAAPGTETQHQAPGHSSSTPIVIEEEHEAALRLLEALTRSGVGGHAAADAQLQS